jgi:hypothetical protein
LELLGYILPPDLSGFLFTVSVVALRGRLWNRSGPEECDRMAARGFVSESDETARRRQCLKITFLSGGEDPDGTDRKMPEGINACQSQATLDLKVEVGLREYGRNNQEN